MAPPYLCRCGKPASTQSAVGVTSMKGIVFVEFLEMVESTFSAEMADDIIDACDLSSGGAYTSVGTYPHSEIVREGPAGDL